jgi:DNA-binding XRE family transcriptional regulator
MHVLLSQERKRMKAAAARPVPPQAHPDASATLSKAVRNAASLLEIRQNALARILGVSPATASRLCAGTYQLSPERGKEWELAILLVRLFRSLDAMVGHDADAKKWLASDNLGLGQPPLALMESAEGLVRVLHYVDAHRGRI